MSVPAFYPCAVLRLRVLPWVQTVGTILSVPAHLFAFNKQGSTMSSSGVGTMSSGYVPTRWVLLLYPLSTDVSGYYAEQVHLFVPTRWPIGPARHTKYPLDICRARTMPKLPSGYLYPLGGEAEQVLFLPWPRPHFFLLPRPQSSGLWPHSFCGLPRPYSFSGFGHIRILWPKSVWPWFPSICLTAFLDCHDHDTPCHKDGPYSGMTL